MVQHKTMVSPFGPSWWQFLRITAGWSKARGSMVPVHLWHSGKTHFMILEFWWCCGSSQTMLPATTTSMASGSLGALLLSAGM